MLDSVRRTRFRWPLLVLLVSIGLTALAVVEAQRAVRSQQAVARRALREYATFAAWSYGQHLTEALGNLQREAIGAVNHGDNMHTSMQVPHAVDLPSYLPFDMACYCHRARRGPNPQSFFAMRIGKDWLEVARSDHEDPPRYSDAYPMPAMPPDMSRPVYSEADKRWIVDSLTRRIRGWPEIDHGFTLVVDGQPADPRIIAYTLMPTTWGDTMVYGARYAHDAFADLLDDVLDGNGLLPSTFTQGRRNRDVLAVRVRDQRGETLFDSAPGVTSPLDAHLELPSRAGSLVIDAVIRPELAGALIIGGLPRSRLPFLLGLLGLAAALSIVAVTQLRREGELARLRADFVSSVSHELRTPLAQIRLYSETLRLGRTKTEEERAWSLSHIERETKRLTHLVENVLRFSTLERLPHAPVQPVDVSAEVAAIIEEFQPLADAQGARIEASLEPVPSVPLRADAIRHILLNLLDNALKYGPAGQTVRVALQVVEGEVRLSVADEGPGVTRTDEHEIWRAFTRGTAAVAKGGSGIGLTIVRELAEQHGGRAWVEGDGVRGARFVVALPLSASTVA